MVAACNGGIILDEANKLLMAGKWWSRGKDGVSAGLAVVTTCWWS